MGGELSINTATMVKCAFIYSIVQSRSSSTAFIVTMETAWMDGALAQVPPIIDRLQRYGFRGRWG
jgi:hypothetical protein